MGDETHYDPLLGLNTPGGPGRALDLMEEFRPYIVDRLARIAHSHLARIAHQPY